MLGAGGLSAATLLVMVVAVVGITGVGRGGGLGVLCACCCLDEIVDRRRDCLSMGWD